MKYHIIVYNFMFIVFSIIFLLSCTSASWLLKPFDMPPPTPELNVLKSCTEWLRFYGFDDCATKNMEMAQERAKKYDNDVAVYAVIYAHVLVAFPGLIVDKYCMNGPWYHCKHYNGYEIPIQLYTLKSFALSCTGWIYLYRFTTDDNIFNWSHAMTRDTNEDGAISVWAAGYAQFLANVKSKNSISVVEYCSGMGLGNTNNMEFMSFNETTKTCIEWIHLSEYGNNINDNLRKYREQDKRFISNMNTWTQLYIKYLHSLRPKRNIFGQVSTKVQDSMPLTPTQYCYNEKMTDDVPLKYFKNITAS